jgi:pseudouridine-5'-phosphate glycosidase
MTDVTAWLETSQEVQAALDSGGAVLALESTIITHGMPYPQNLETALQAEQAARDEGATPATIAVIEGKLKAGLSGAELETLARAGSNAIKTSRRDLPFVMATAGCGGTTVAATMIIAGLAGIEVFATGGIGGVHRGAQQSMDVSADLEELANTRVAVVCAGPKSILDIGLTLEYLETRGVAVVGYRTDELPAFFTAHSGFAVDYRLDSAAEIAAVLHTKWSLGLRGGMVIANPIAAENSLDAATVESHITTACSDAGKLGIKGRQLTPYLLQRVQELSGGDSLAANVQLLLANTRLGARIAMALQRHRACLAGADDSRRSSSV